MFACAGEQLNQEIAETPIELHPYDTLPHGIPLELEGTRVDSFETEKQSFNRQKKISLEPNKIEAPIPDTLDLRETVIAQTPGTDTFDLALELDFTKWEKEFIYPRPIIAGNPEKSSSSLYDLRYHNIQSGLPTDAIFRLLCDRNGNIWMAMRNKGVLRFDGHSFLHLTRENGLIDESVTNIYEDSRGNIWFMTNKGFSKFNGHSFTNYQVNGVDRTEFRCVTETAEGDMYFGTWGLGMVVLKNEKLYSYSLEQGVGASVIYDIAYHPDGSIWLGQRDNGLGIYKDGTFYTHPYDNGIFERSVRAIEFDGEDMVWLGTEGGLVKYDYKNELYLDYQQTDYLGYRLVWDLHLDRTGNLWIAPFRKGIVRFDGENAWHYGEENGLSNHTSRSIIEDPQGMIWIATDHGGVNIMNTEGFEYGGDLEETQISNIYSLANYRGEIWAQYFRSGVAVISENDVQFVEERKEKLWQSSFVDKDTNLWISSMFHLYYYNGDSLTSFLIKDKLETGVLSFAHDFEGNMWFGRKAGLMIYADSVFTNFDAENGFTYDPVYALLADDKKVWVGTKGSGLFKYEAGKFTRYTKHEGLHTDKINCLFKNNDGLWIGTDGGGVYLLDENEEFTNYRDKDGLSDNYVQSFIEDKNANLWIASENGLTVKVDDQFIAYTDESRLNATDFNQRSVVMDDNNNILWGTTSGFVRLNTANFKIDSIIPILSINHILIEQQTVNFRELQKKLANDSYFPEQGGLDLSEMHFDSLTKFQNTPHGLELPHTIDQITLNFACSNINGSQSFKYTYFLEGSNSEWSPLNDENKATFNNLDYGDYVFRVKAQNQFGIWSEELTYSFSIATPWWHQWWAYLIYALIFIGLLYSFFRIRVARFKQQQIVLEKTVDQRTNELKLQKERVEEQHLEIKDSITYAKRIQEAILPTSEHFKEHLKQSFILYKPKDIVAGDFYWLESKNDAILFAVADCTGHGVPGAMVSVVCNGALNRAVREFGLEEPGQILDKTREIVIDEFEKSRDDVKDGMDIALCSIKGNELRYAGANNPLWIIRNGEIMEFKADKEPIGKFANQQPYTTKSIALEQGDCLYIFSDGFVDQFGGEHLPNGRVGGKKFKPRALRKLLLEVQDKDMNQQKELINAAFENWRGELDQVDDVCLIGVRV
jgi:ligand-binding sensor domain-containing protein/serine phosphatase RsbU (regulator of sigma subunit)